MLYEKLYAVKNKLSKFSWLLYVAGARTDLCLVVNIDGRRDRGSSVKYLITLHTKSFIANNVITHSVREKVSSMFYWWLTNMPPPVVSESNGQERGHKHFGIQQYKSYNNTIHVIGN